MGDFGALVTAALPVVGIIIGAALHHWFTRTQERQKQTEVLRDQAYADYLRTVAQLGAARHVGREEPEELIWRSIEVRARIATYGTTRVGEALARFHRAGAVISGEGEELFLELCQAMRADSAAGQAPLSQEDLGVILLASRQPRPGRAAGAGAKAGRAQDGATGPRAASEEPAPVEAPGEAGGGEGGAG
jgi:hypothetical protein